MGLLDGEIDPSRLAVPMAAGTSSADVALGSKIINEGALRCGNDVDRRRLGAAVSMSESKYPW